MAVLGKNTCDRASDLTVSHAGVWSGRCYPHPRGRPVILPSGAYQGRRRRFLPAFEVEYAAISCKTCSLSKLKCSHMALPIFISPFQLPRVDLYASGSENQDEASSGTDEARSYIVFADGTTALDLLRGRAVGKCREAINRSNSTAGARGQTPIIPRGIRQVAHPDPIHQSRRLTLNPFLETHLGMMIKIMRDDVTPDAISQRFHLMLGIDSGASEQEKRAAAKRYFERYPEEAGLVGGHDISSAEVGEDSAMDNESDSCSQGEESDSDPELTEVCSFVAVSSTSLSASLSIANTPQPDCPAPKYTSTGRAGCPTSSRQGK